MHLITLKLFVISILKITNYSFLPQYFQFFNHNHSLIHYITHATAIKLLNKQQEPSPNCVLQGRNKILLRCDTNQGAQASEKQLKTRTVAMLTTLCCRLRAPRKGAAVESACGLEAGNLAASAVINSTVRSYKISNYWHKRFIRWV
jgi:hypothetical protein